MDYNEVTSSFSKLVETHFLQRCPLMAGAGKKESGTSETQTTPGTPVAPVSVALPTPESFPDCYKVPHVTLIGRGKRQLSTEDGEDQRNAKKARMDSEVGGLTSLVTPAEEIIFHLVFVSGFVFLYYAIFLFPH